MGDMEMLNEKYIMDATCAGVRSTYLGAIQVARVRRVDLHKQAKGAVLIRAVEYS